MRKQWKVMFKVKFNEENLNKFTKTILVDYCEERGHYWGRFNKKQIIEKMKDYSKRYFTVDITDLSHRQKKKLGNKLNTDIDISPYTLKETEDFVYVIFEQLR